MVLVVLFMMTIVAVMVTPAIVIWYTSEERKQRIIDRMWYKQYQLALRQFQTNCVVEQGVLRRVSDIYDD